eukprot:1160248-Pelagomonas_calceolata.AAC.5
MSKWKWPALLICNAMGPDSSKEVAGTYTAMLKTIERLQYPETVPAGNAAWPMMEQEANKQELKKKNICNHWRQS